MDIIAAEFLESSPETNSKSFAVKTSPKRGGERKILEIFYIEFSINKSGF